MVLVALQSKSSIGLVEKEQFNTKNIELFTAIFLAIVIVGFQKITNSLSHLGIGDY
jgi:hypothetical protein